MIMENKPFFNLDRPGELMDENYYFNKNGKDNLNYFTSMIDPNFKI